MKILKIKKEQLIPEREFINHCFSDQHGSLIQKLNIDHRFIEAAEKDGFMKPLLIIKEPKIPLEIEGGVVLENNNKIKYYSPFHIYIVAQLAKNVVLDDGFLWGYHTESELN
jgi:hypothetical protein